MMTQQTEMKTGLPVVSKNEKLGLRMTAAFFIVQEKLAGPAHKCHCHRLNDFGHSEAFLSLQGMLILCTSCKSTMNLPV